MTFLSTSKRTLAVLAALSLGLANVAQGKELTPVVAEFPNTSILKALIYAETSSISTANWGSSLAEGSLNLLNYLPVDFLDYADSKVEGSQVKIFDRAQGRELQLGVNVFKKINKYPLHSYLQKVATCLSRGYSEDPGVIFVKALSPEHRVRLFGQEASQQFYNCKAPTMESYLRLLADRGEDY